MLLTTSRRRVWCAAVLVLALVSGATAWAVVDRSPTSAPTAGHEEQSPAALSQGLPFSELLQVGTGAQRNVLKAQEKLGIACMAKLGFQYKPVPIASAAETADDHQTPFGMESVAAPADGEPQPLPSETPASKAFTRALYGDSDDRISAKGKLIQVSRPASGCQAEAEKRLLGDRRLRWLQLRVQLGEGEQAAREQLEKDPAFRAANARWRTCMRAAGFDAKDPVSLLNEIPRGTDLTKHPGVRADVRCKGETNYLSRAYARLHAVQEAWIDRHAGPVTTWRTLQDRQVAVARDVLGAR